MIDELRASFPALGFALYAIEPDGAVTLEVHDGDAVYPFVGATAAEAVTKAFPPEPPPDAAPATPPPSVFD